MSGNEPGKSEPVTVRILDREYTVGVSDGERASLTSAARLLDQRMRELRGSNKLVAPDRLAVLTALNLAHELQQLREERGGYVVSLSKEVLEKARLLVSLGKCRQMLNTLPEARGVLEDALAVLEPLEPAA